MKKGLVVGGIIVVALIGIFVAVYFNVNKEKASITADTFNTTMSGKGYELTDTTSEFAEKENYMKKSYTAKKSSYEIEFYELSNVENATSMYNDYEKEFESQDSDNSASSSKSAKNYSTYSLTTNGKYKYISRIDNTLIYVDVDDDYKDTIKDLMKEIGY